MTTEQLLRDALHEDAGTEHTPADWDGVRARGTHLRRGRRVAQGLVATAAVVVLAVAVLALAGTFSDGGSSRRGVVATPPGPASDAVVVQRADRVDVISATDGHVIATVATGVDTTLISTGVAVAPDGSAVVYTRRSATTGCPELVEQPLPSGRAHVIVGRSWDPLISPDGRWIAYATNDACGTGQTGTDVIGLTDLHTGQNFRPAELRLAQHPAKLELLAWSPASDKLLYDEFRDFGGGVGEKTFALSGLPFASGAPTEALPSLGVIGAAAYLPSGDALIVHATGRGYDVVEVDSDGRTVARRFHDDGAAPSSITPDPSGTRLLTTLPDGSLLVQEGSDAPRAIASGVQSAVWLPSAASGSASTPLTSTPTSGAPPSSSPTSPSTTAALPSELVAATGDNRLMELDPATGAVRRTVAALAASVTWVQLTPDGRAAWVFEPDPGLPCSAQINPGTIARIDLSSGKPTDTVKGWSPALSPDGKLLAYTKVPCDGRTPPALAVRTLATGTERTWSLAPTADKSARTISGPVAWARDSRHLVVRVDTLVSTAEVERMLEVDTSVTTPSIDGPTLPTDVLDLSTGSTPDTFVAIAAAPSTPVVVESVPTGGDPPTALFAPPETPGRVTTDASGTRVLLVAGAGPALYRWSTGDAAPTKLADGIVAADW